jgi:hypothetical protein
MTKRQFVLLKGDDGDDVYYDVEKIAAVGKSPEDAGVSYVVVPGVATKTCLINPDDLIKKLTDG